MPADVLIGRLAEILKKEELPRPDWVPFVKTGVHADKPPQDRAWWHTRCASLMRKIYLHGPIGINGLRSEYGGGKPRGYGAANHRKAGGAIIRNAVHGLEKLGYIEKLDKKGRIVSRQGMQKLDRLSTEILGEMAATNPQLKVYS
ncbi:ribosomal protein S19E [Cenarchaeum symbiosum A]|uniref:Small ribosomal subunit protein eS19 n=1 Tax=Cenarchaeum symbiosum (strain A) TaxID=414004 RepID=A0RYF9_CENSY|nr:ribosomal protein S19E [Cenarchaeum symbiosum A]